jgi:hypothetical protein
MFGRQLEGAQYMGFRHGLVMPGGAGIANRLFRRQRQTGPQTGIVERRKPVAIVSRRCKRRAGFSANG